MTHIVTSWDRTGEKAVFGGKERTLLPSGIVCWGVTELVWVPSDEVDEWKRNRPWVFGAETAAQPAPKTPLTQRAQEDAAKGPGHKATPAQLGTPGDSPQWLEYDLQYNAAVRRILATFGGPLPGWAEFGGVWAGRA